MNNPITVYGADWCRDTQRVREYLEGFGVPYNFIDVDQDPEAAQIVIEANGGKRRVPVVVVNWRGHEQVLVVPTTDEIRGVIDAMAREAGDSAA